MEEDYFISSKERHRMPLDALQGPRLRPDRVQQGV
jgi:hypothetical protein